MGIESNARPRRKVTKRAMPGFIVEFSDGVKDFSGPLGRLPSTSRRKKERPDGSESTLGTDHRPGRPTASRLSKTSLERFSERPTSSPTSAHPACHADIKPKTGVDFGDVVDALIKPDANMSTALVNSISTCSTRFASPDVSSSISNSPLQHTAPPSVASPGPDQCNDSSDLRCHSPLAHQDTKLSYPLYEPIPSSGATADATTATLTAIKSDVSSLSDGNAHTLDVLMLNDPGRSSTPNPANHIEYPAHVASGGAFYGDPPSSCSSSAVGYHQAFHSPCGDLVPSTTSSPCGDQEAAAAASYHYAQLVAYSNAAAAIAELGCDASNLRQYPHHATGGGVPGLHDHLTPSVSVQQHAAGLTDAAAHMRPINFSEVKGVYKNCRGIWAAQWTDEKGQRHTKYFNPKYYVSEAEAKLEAYRFKVRITQEIGLKGRVPKRRRSAASRTSVAKHSPGSLPEQTNDTPISLLAAAQGLATSRGGGPLAMSYIEDLLRQKLVRNRGNRGCAGDGHRNRGAARLATQQRLMSCPVGPAVRRRGGGVVRHGQHPSSKIAASHMGFRPGGAAPANFATGTLSKTGHWNPSAPLACYGGATPTDQNGLDVFGAPLTYGDYHTASAYQQWMNAYHSLGGIHPATPDAPALLPHNGLLPTSSATHESLSNTYYTYDTSTGVVQVRPASAYGNRIAAPDAATGEPASTSRSTAAYADQKDGSGTHIITDQSANSQTNTGNIEDYQSDCNTAAANMGGLGPATQAGMLNLIAAQNFYASAGLDANSVGLQLSGSASVYDGAYHPAALSSNYQHHPYLSPESQCVMDAHAVGVMQGDSTAAAIGADLALNTLASLAESSCCANEAASDSRRSSAVSSVHTGGAGMEQLLLASHPQTNTIKVEEPYADVVMPNSSQQPLHTTAPRDVTLLIAGYDAEADGVGFQQPCDDGELHPGEAAQESVKTEPSPNTQEDASALQSWAQRIL